MQWHFGPFRLDLVNACLWHAAQPVPLRPKTFEVLVYLVTHAGQLVTKDALLDAVWPETAVGDGVLKTSMNELRKALGETAKAPQWIATVHRRGYRFIAPVTLMESAPPPVITLTPVAPLPVPVPALVIPPAPVSAPTPAPRLVGREAEVATLRQWFANALQAERHLGFVTGEAGIGKTTLVDTFVDQLTGQTPLWIGRGQCIEQYGAGEAYLPLLEALGQMGRTPDGPQLVALLRQQAPSWLLQLPALLSPGEYEALQRYAGGTTRERMLRELTEAMEALTAVRPCVLVLEDLHWSDTATIEWLAYMARRRGPARLLVLGTYRPVEALVRVHPVRAMVHELTVHGYGAELPLGELSEAGVAAYLTQRGAGAEVPVALVRVLTQRTDGHPLFLVAVVDELIRQELLRLGPEGWVLARGLDAVMGGVPQSIRHLLEQQVAQLQLADQELLAVASVAGVEFTVAAVAAGVQQTEEDVEAQCDALAHQYQLVQAHGTAVWPDRTVTARYGFRHALYQELLYDRIPVSRRARWHRQIGLRLEIGYGLRAREMAAELAEHFVRGRDPARAVPYLQYAGEQAVQRSAHQEALRHCTQGLELLATMPETLAQAQQELDLQIALGSVLIATQGRGAPEVEQTYARARVLCQQIGETPQLFSTLQGLCGFYRSRGALLTARELGEQLDQLAQRDAEPTHRLEAHGTLGGILFYLGEYAAARTHLERGLTLLDPRAQRDLSLRYNVTTGVTWCLVHAALTLWCLGYPAQALRRSQEALALAQPLAYPYGLGLAHHYAACLHHHRREASAVQAQAEALLTLATAQGFPLWGGFGMYWRGWALAMQGEGAAGLAQMYQGMTAVLATGQELARPFCLVQLAAASGHIGHVTEGLCLLAEGRTALETSGRGDLVAEAHRLQGEFLLRQAVPDVAHTEACFHQALALARRQQAKSWELRAALSLGRLWQRQGRRQDAHDLVAPVYGWFTEGFDTADLQEAKALLEELA